MSDINGFDTEGYQYDMEVTNILDKENKSQGSEGKGMKW